MSDGERVEPPVAPLAGGVGTRDLSEGDLFELWRLYYLQYSRYSSAWNGSPGGSSRVAGAVERVSGLSAVAGEVRVRCGDVVSDGVYGSGGTVVDTCLGGPDDCPEPSGTGQGVRVTCTSGRTDAGGYDGGRRLEEDSGVRSRGETVGECSAGAARGDSRWSSGDRVSRAVEGGEASGVHVVGGLSARGPNWLRNHTARVRRKAQRVAKREAMSGDWRARGSEVPASVGAQGSGFFSECSQDVQQKLRESRARMLIARNERQAKEEEEKARNMDSVRGVVKQMTDVAVAVEKLRRQSKDQAVIGWDNTVSSGLSKSIVDGASGVPSLESVGFGASGLESTGGEVQDPVRLAAYHRNIKFVEDSFADMDGYAEDEYQYALDGVKEEFADVAFTPLQREVAKFKRDVAVRLCAEGVSHNVVSEAVFFSEK